MDELVPIRKENNRRLVSARDLYKALKVKHRFSSWWGQNSKDLKAGRDFTSVLTSTVVANGAKKPIQDYWLTIDNAKKIAMQARTEIGNKVRDYFIEVEKKYKAQKSLRQPDSYMIEDPIKRAKRWIQEQEAFQAQKKLADKQAKQLKEEQDDVVFAKAIRYSHHAISMQEMSSILTENGFKIGRNQLFNLLRMTGYLGRVGDTHNMPRGEAMKKGFFRIVHRISQRDGRPYRKVLVEPKGQKHLINKALRGGFDEAYQKVMVNTLEM